jgi:polar amino acid transport system substrate-binding protein
MASPVTNAHHPGRWLASLALLSAAFSFGCKDAAPPAQQEAPTSAATAAPAKNKIRVATEAAYPPMEFVDPKTGEITGYDIDLMREVAAAAGYEVEFVNAEWTAIFGLLSNRSVDAIISSVTITEERKKNMSFTDPYYQSSQRVVIRAADKATYTGLDKLEGKAVGVQVSTTAAEMMKSDWAKIELKSYDNVILGLQDLANKRVEAFVVDDPVARYYVAKKLDMGLALVEQQYTSEQFGIVVHPQDTALRDRLNAGLKKVKEGDVARRLEEKWFR